MPSVRVYLCSAQGLFGTNMCLDTVVELASTLPGPAARMLVLLLSTYNSFMATAGSFLTSTLPRMVLS